jgi:uncharacterized protein involved in outer membrane biogenesis
MKKLLFVLAVLAVAVAVLLIGRNFLLKTAVESILRNSTDFDLSIGSVNMALLDSSFEVTGLELRNPPDFPDPEAFAVDRFLVDYDLSSLLSDEVHLYNVVIDIPKVIMVRKADGESNVERLAAAAKKDTKPEGGGMQEPKGGGAAEEKGAPAGKPAKEAKKVRIDRLTVKLGKVEMRDYSRGRTEPKVYDYELNMNRTYNDITDLQKLGATISTELLVTAAPQVLNDLSTVLEENRDEIKAAGKELEKAAKDLKKQFEGMRK